MRVAAILDLALVAWFVFLAGVEFVVVRRRQSGEEVGDGRLVTNFGFGVLTLGLNSLVPIAKIGSSFVARDLGGGVAIYFAWPWVAALAALVLLDSFAAYWTHRAMHVLSMLWRVHRVHHSDQSVDVSTSFRNHPLELVVTVPTVALVILLIGAPPSVVLANYTMMFAAAVWQHADIDLPAGIERALEWVIVTPQLHRLHHNPKRAIHDSNYGELLTVWDRLFGTLNRAEGHLPVGLEDQVAPPDQLFQQIWSPMYEA